ncbi:unnamed protein product, partial [Rangifer tarandus platyrhynchus]
TVACQAFLSITSSWNLLKLMSIESVMPSTISSSVVPFSCLQSFSASGSFPMSRFFASLNTQVESITIWGSLSLSNLSILCFCSTSSSYLSLLNSYSQLNATESLSS